MMNNQKATIYQFRDNLAEDLLSLQRTFLYAEETVERLLSEARMLTCQKQCTLEQVIFEAGAINYFDTQRQLLLLQDKLTELSASFKHGKLSKLLNESTDYIEF